MLRGNKIIAFCIFICLFTPYMSQEANAKESYEIEANSNLIIEFSEETWSLFIIEVDNSISKLIFSIDVKNQYDGLEATRTNYTKENFIFTFIGIGSFKLTIDNPNAQILEISISIESFTLVVNDETGGFSHKDKIFCWNFVSGVEDNIQSIESLKRRYYNLYFSSAMEDISARLWFSFYHPDSNPDWNDLLKSTNIVRNQKILTEVEDQELWLVTDVTSLGSFDITIVLRSTIAGNFVIIIVGVSAAVVGVIVFALYYFNPLKYRKRKVGGKDYTSVKKEFEQPEDIGDTITELITNKMEKNR